MSEAKLGRKQTPEWIEKRANAHRGIPRPPEVIEAISRAQVGKIHPAATCPKCGKTGAKPGLVRWHFDNCKVK